MFLPRSRPEQAPPASQPSHTQSGKDMSELIKSGSINLTHPKEEELALHLCKFPEAIEDCINEQAPNK